jgi:hypothetical protein
MCEKATLERIIQAVRELPEHRAAEVLDFAEFLQSRKPDSTPEEGTFESYFGKLKNAPLFYGRDPVTVQREMRDEWR